VVSPFVIALGEAFSVTVGVAAGAGAVAFAAGVLVAACFWHPAKIKIAAIAIGNAIRFIVFFLMNPSKGLMD
jgi:hypothetical protein